MWRLSAAVTAFVGCWPALEKDEGDSLCGETWERWLSIADLSNISCRGPSIHKLCLNPKRTYWIEIKWLCKNWQHKPVMVGTRKGLGKQKAAVFIRGQDREVPFPLPPQIIRTPRFPVKLSEGLLKGGIVCSRHTSEKYGQPTLPLPEFGFGYSSAPDYSTGLPSRVINGGFCQAPGNNSCL